jgi:uncharacterized alpha-E superfamily protein
MSRYLERAEHTARVVSVNLNLTLDRTPDAAGHHWGRLLSSLPAPPVARAATTETDAGPMGDLASRESIAACLSAARENARQIREQISSEMWEQVNRLFLQVRSASTDAYWGTHTHEFFTSVLEGVHLFQGMTDATMTHSEGWHYIQVGRFLERSAATAAMLNVHYDAFSAWNDHPIELDEFVEWMGLLKSSCAFEAYCRCYTADLNAARVAEFLILNADFPRSIRFAAGRIESALKAITRHSSRSGGRADRLAGRLRAALDFGQIDEILAVGLHGYLKDIIRQCAEIHTAMYQTYITYPIEATLSA